MKIAVLKDLSGRSVNSHDKEAKTNVTGHFIRVVLRQRKRVGTNENTFTQNQRWLSMGGVAAYRVCHVTCIKYLQHVTSFQSLDVTESRVPSPHTQKFSLLPSYHLSLSRILCLVYLFLISKLTFAILTSLARAGKELHAQS